MAMASMSIDWGQVGAGIAAIGAFGTAAFGVTDSLGKVLTLGYIGLPYAGFGAIRKMMTPLNPALNCAYGPDYIKIVAQQYRVGGSGGSAPDTVRQGVRLGLPFLEVTVAAGVIESVWAMGGHHATNLANALQAGAPAADGSGGTGAVSLDQALAGRFATALDARVTAAFELADQTYEAAAKSLAGIVSVVLACVFNWTLGNSSHSYYPWPAVVAAGLVAVPLAPIANDLSNYLQNALNSFKAFAGKS